VSRSHVLLSSTRSCSYATRSPPRSTSLFRRSLWSCCGDYSPSAISRLVFITHNLALVRSIAQTVVVLAAGTVVESGPSETCDRRTRATPYTARLMEDVPELLAGRWPTPDRGCAVATVRTETARLKGQLRRLAGEGQEERWRGCRPALVGL